MALWQCLVRNVGSFLIGSSGLRTTTQVLLISGVQWLARTTSITEPWFAFVSVVCMPCASAWA